MIRQRRLAGPAKPPIFFCMGSTPIEDYGLIGDCETAALVSRDGSIDWLCWPRFDSPACFAALPGSPKNGRWRIPPPENHVTRVTGAYRDGTMVLETEFVTVSGSATVIELVTHRRSRPHGRG
jgi:GH15 family glucan-1,4-alpha-glucosidase